MSTIIKVENLSKRYLIRHQQGDKYQTFRDTIANGTKKMLTAPVRWLNGTSMGKEKAVEEFWALKDVSFDVAQGDRVGIIGRNGAGKSTLLKLLSRITEPTHGRIQIKGRVASLLEVGTGFHPELSGRENIFLNGSILGMRKSEIEKKFDEIVAFSGVERFLDTPVKRYSSGMYVRLAFSVAAHLEPEVLIIDEVLAVGDIEFQKKCLGKMESVSKEGRTILFVSHSMAAISRLTNKCVLLACGEVEMIGSTDQVARKYLTVAGADNVIGSRKVLGKHDYVNRWTYSNDIVFHEAGLCKGATSELSINGSLSLDIVLNAKRVMDNLRIGYGITNDANGAVMMGFSAPFTVLHGGLVHLQLQINDINLAPGTYFLDLSIGSGNDIHSRRENDVIQGIGKFTVNPRTSDGEQVEWSNGWAKVIHHDSRVEIMETQ